MINLRYFYHRFPKIEMPIVFNKNIDDQTILAVWKIQESEAELISGLQLKQHEHDFIATLNNGKRLLHWLSTRLLLRTLLNTTDYIDCRMDAHGKPYLVNMDYEISLSHSFDYAAVMISGNRKVGVDIELMNNLRSDVAEVKAKAVLSSIYNIRANMLHGEKHFEEHQRMLLEPLIRIIQTIINLELENLK